MKHFFCNFSQVEVQNRRRKENARKSARSRLFVINIYALNVNTNFINECYASNVDHYCFET